MSLINSIVQHIMNFQPSRSINPLSEVLKGCRLAEGQRCELGVCTLASLRTLICEWARLVFSVFTALIQCLVLGQLPPGHNFVSPFPTLLGFFLMCTSALLSFSLPDIF